ncbi:MAG: hypothetical protein ABI416_01910, partial [Ginsengibacter sp.]
DNSVDRYVIYNFEDTSKMNNEDPKNIKEIIEGGNNYYKFNLQDIPAQQDKIIIAVTSLTKTNNESALSRYIYLERKSNGWHAVTQPGNK